LIAALRSSGDDAGRRLRVLPQDAYAQGRYENGWSARQILAHVAAIEWTYPRLLDLAQQAQGSAGAPATGVRRTTPEEATGTLTRIAEGGIDAYNARQVEKRANASIPELIGEFERNRAAPIAAMEAADGALFSRQIRSAGGITGTLADVLRAVAVEHVAGHVRDIAETTA
jgi:hypothetical protein